MGKKLFDAYDKEIMRVLITEGLPLTIAEIARKASMSWATAQKHVMKLVGYNLVHEVPTESRRKQVPKVVWNFEKYGDVAEAI